MQYLKENIPKVSRTKRRQNGGFSELVIPVIKGNGALSEVTGIVHLAIVQLRNYVVPDPSIDLDSRSVGIHPC